MKKTLMIGFVTAMMTLVAYPSWGQMSPSTHVPVIKAYYAVDKARFGDPFYIYLEAEDPDGDMLRIATVASQIGGGDTHLPDWVFLKQGNFKHFVGYLHWNTFGDSTYVSEWTKVTLNISVFDKAGNESNVVVVPILFEMGSHGIGKLPAPFDQANVERLGYVNIQVRNWAHTADARDLTRLPLKP